MGGSRSSIDQVWQEFGISGRGQLRKLWSAAAAEQDTVRTQIKVAVGLIGFLLAFITCAFVGFTILHGLGVNYYAEVPIVLVITAVVFFASMPRLEALMAELEETAPEWRPVIRWFRQQA